MSADAATLATVDAAHAGRRLDAALSLLSDLGVRGRRRLIEDGAVLVNGKRGRSGQTVAAGDVISLLPPDRAGTDMCPKARLIGIDGDYAFFHKPAGLHTVRLRGRDNGCLEAQAHDLVPGRSPELLQRLDLQTSGIVAAALSPAAAAAFREAERAGAVEKRYACLLAGALSGDRLARGRLVSSGGASMRVLDEPDPDAARWTLFTPLEVLEEADGAPGPFTLAGAIIRRGARHQIRAHAASLGLPLAGDVRYGGPALSSGTFFLHHGRLCCLGRAVTAEPDPGAAWDRALPACRRWFASGGPNP